MPRLPVLSGRELVKLLKKIGFVPVRRRGSHIVLSKSSPEGRKGLVVPDHKEIDKRTLVEIIRQAGLTRRDFLELFGINPLEREKEVKRKKR
ncbi:MAG: type II toxin-antitoxin system HicA family toxin [Candidatus Altiarchaeales archaeon]|nr:type II toxin-antitoxin system HicA family toxin [Candidatus Altiarchaeales archaeon]